MMTPAKPDERGRRGRRIQARVLLLVSVGMLGPLSVAAWARLRSQREMEREVLSDRALLARFVAERAEVLLSSEMKDLEATSAPASLALGAQAVAHQRTALRENFVRHHALFDSVFLLDGQGHVLAQEPANAEPLDGQRILEEAARVGRPAYTDLETFTRSSRRLFAIVPMKTPQGLIAGAVGGVIDPTRAHLSAFFKGNKLAPGESVELIDRRGTVLASTQPSRVFQQSEHAQLLAELIRDRVALPGPHEGQKTIRAGELLAFAPLSVARWGVAVRQPEDQALAATGALGLNVLRLNLALFAVAVLFAWGAARSVTRPLATLTMAAERLTAGELFRPIPELPDDEVGRLGAALERMRVALQESLHKVEEARRELEGRVAERTQDLSRLNGELVSREKTVRVLLGKVISAQEDERRRVARELHDETTGSLSALVMRVQAAMAVAPEGELRARLADANALAVHTLDEVHRMIAALRPSVLDDLGLKSAILWYAERHLKPRGISVRCEFKGLEGRLAPQIETVVFRVVQEAMTNIGKHAHAENVLVQADLTEGNLTVEVEDDGEGFETQALERPGREGRGWGLLGMRERVEMLQGKLTLDSAKGQGTRLALTVPVPPGVPEVVAHG